MTKKTKQIHVLITEEENAILEKSVAKRGIPKSDFVKEKVFMDKPMQLYNKDTEEAIHEITELMVYELAKYCNDRVFCKKCKEGAKKLWHSLNQ